MGPGCRVEPACTQQSEPFKVSYRSPNFRSADHEIAPNSIFFPAVGCRPRWSFGWPAVARAGKGPTCLVCFSTLSVPPCQTPASASSGEATFRCLPIEETLKGGRPGCRLSVPRFLVYRFTWSDADSGLLRELAFFHCALIMSSSSLRGILVHITGCLRACPSV